MNTISDLVENLKRIAHTPEMRLLVYQLASVVARHDEELRDLGAIVAELRMRVGARP